MANQTVVRVAGIKVKVVSGLEILMMVVFIWAKLGGYLNDVSWWWIMLALLV